MEHECTPDHVGKLVVSDPMSVVVYSEDVSLVVQGSVEQLMKPHLAEGAASRVQKTGHRTQAEADRRAGSEMQRGSEEQAQEPRRGVFGLLRRALGPALRAASRTSTAVGREERARTACGLRGCKSCGNRRRFPAFIPVRHSGWPKTNIGAVLVVCKPLM